jgi:hypothetical protein
MPIGYYTRTEPRTRSDDLAEGLAARIYDPAWLLARQWQVGELHADNGGTPIRVRHMGESTRCTAYIDRGGTRAIDTNDGPWEALAEASVELPAAWTLRLRVDIGRALVRALRAAGLSDRVEQLATAFPLTRDSEDQGHASGMLALAAGLIPDGGQAYDTLAAGLRATPPTLPTLPGVTVDDPLIAAAVEWLGFCDAVLGPPNSQAWHDGRMEHTFTVQSPGPTTTVELVAVAHPGGPMDWWSFDARRTAADPAASSVAHDATTIPTAVTFRGMPTPRWWQQEDASIDLGGVDAHPADLARMAVLHFALVYGNDHFAVPLRLPVGSVFRTNHLLVTDTFGATTLIRPAAHPDTSATRPPGSPRWTMYTLTTIDSPGDDVAGEFVLPATAEHRLTAPPLDEVLLLRDEMANLAWAVEAVVEGADGRPLRRAERWHQPPTTEPPASGPLRYRLGTTVPPHWFPLVPQRTTDGDVPTLVVQPMAHSEAEDAEPHGAFLSFGLQVADDRIPREGRRLLRDQVLVRWVDGSTKGWRRRRSTIGRGEGSSGLRFDDADFTE